MNPFYCFQTMLSDPVYILSKTDYLIQLLVKKEKRKKFVYVNVPIFLNFEFSDGSSLVTVIKKNNVF